MDGVMDLPLGKPKSTGDKLDDAQAIKVSVAEKPSPEPPPVVALQKAVDEAIEVLTFNLEHLFTVLTPVLTPESEVPPQANLPEEALTSPIAKKQADWRNQLLTLAQNVKHVDERLEI